MKVLITGANGQLGQELMQRVPLRVNAVACDSRQLDITDRNKVHAVFERMQPDVVINAAAYTQVDDAETQPDQAYAVNETGTGNLAAACAVGGARLLQVSTDFVFDGRQVRLYEPGDLTSPQCIYGASKRAGEISALDVTGARALIMRTSWLYSAHGGNFVNSMLGLMRDKPELGVVADQIGSPTWAGGLATALWRCLDYPRMQGIWHYADAGVASWYDFAVAIQQLALERGLLTRPVPVKPLATEEFPRPAARPAFSAFNSRATLQALNLAPMHWREALAKMLDEIRHYEFGNPRKRAHA